MSSVQLTAAVSNLGGLGSYGLYGYTPDRITKTIKALSESTDMPFAVNLWIPTGDEVQPQECQLDDAINAARPLFEEVAAKIPNLPATFLPSYKQQLEAVIEAKPAVVSFVFGVPSKPDVARLHDRGIKIIGTATTVEEAIALENGGVDAIVATGMEAAGHRVSFLQPATESLVGGLSLIPQVADATSLPVIAAGGIADRRGVAAAFSLGASAAQVGTAFLRTTESAATDAHREAISAAGASDTKLTTALSGRLARGIENRAMQTLERANQIAPFPAQNWITFQFRSIANEEGLGELQSLWAGQSSALAKFTNAELVFEELALGIPSKTR